MDEFSQQDVFHPDFLGLVAVNLAGDFNCGTPVYDLTSDSALHPDRNTPIHRLLTVLDLDPGYCGIKGDTLALNLGYGGRLDQGVGYLPFVDHREGVVGIGDMVTGGGPFLLDQGFCIHNLGKDKDGRKIVPLHLSTRALFAGPGGDAPLDFEAVGWTPVQEDVGGFWKQCHIRLNTETSHTAGCNARPGRWQIEVQIPITERPPPWIDPPPIGDPPPLLDDPLISIPSTYFPVPNVTGEIQDGPEDLISFPDVNEELGVRPGSTGVVLLT